MKFFNNFFNFYINTSIHVALSVFAMVKITEQYLGLNTHKNLAFFIFFSTITGYNFVKYAGLAKLHHASLTDNLKMIQIFSFLSFLGVCYFGYLLPVKVLLFTVPLSVLTFLYAVPFLSGFHKNLRNISYLKIVVVAIVWAGFSVVIPVVASNKTISFDVFLLALQRFLIVVVLILPFDIRDVKYDAISLQTIPKKIGVEKTKRLGLIIMVFALFIEYTMQKQVVTKNVFMLFFFLVVVFLMRAKIEQSKYYSSFWIESLPIVWWLLLLGFHNF